MTTTMARCKATAVLIQREQEIPAESVCMNQNPLMPPTAVVYNHDAYPPASEAANHQITHKQYALKIVST